MQDASFHLAADDAGQDFRAEGALSTSAPSAEESWPAAYIWQPGMSIKRFLAFELPDCECTFEPLYSGPTARHAPELLEALRDALEYIPARARPVLLAKARAAIAKATGEAS